MSLTSRRSLHRESCRYATSVVLSGLLVLLVVLSGSSVLAQATLIQDINTGSTNSNPTNYIEFNGEVVFAADDGSGTELWKTDGVTATLVANINPAGGSNPSEFAIVNNLLFFAANDGTTGTELYVYDGANVTQVLDINPGVFSGNPRFITPLPGGNVVIFAADDGVNGNELWRSDGTPGGTFMIVDLFPGGVPPFGVFSGNPSNFTPFLGELFFSADNGASGTELFRTDGTAGGTSLVADIYPGTGLPFNQPNSSFPSDLTVVGSDLFVRFRRLDVSGGGVEGFDPIEIRLDCLAPSQTIARAYIVELEELGVFDSVELIETRREQIDEFEVIGFQIMMSTGQANDSQGATNGG